MAILEGNTGIVTAGKKAQSLANKRKNQKVANLSDAQEKRELRSILNSGMPLTDKQRTDLQNRIQGVVPLRKVDASGVNTEEKKRPSFFSTVKDTKIASSDLSNLNIGSDSDTETDTSTFGTSFTEQAGANLADASIYQKKEDNIYRDTTDAYRDLEGVFKRDETPKKYVPNVKVFSDMYGEGYQAEKERRGNLYNTIQKDLNVGSLGYANESDNVKYDYKTNTYTKDGVKMTKTELKNYQADKDLRTKIGKFARSKEFDENLALSDAERKSYETNMPDPDDRKIDFYSYDPFSKKPFNERKFDYQRKNINYGTAEDGTPTGTITGATSYAGQDAAKVYGTEQLKKFIAADAKQDFENKEGGYAVETVRTGPREIGSFEKFFMNLPGMKERETESLSKQNPDQLVDRDNYNYGTSFPKGSFNITTDSGKKETTKEPSTLQKVGNFIERVTRPPSAAAGELTGIDKALSGATKKLNLGSSGHTVDGVYMPSMAEQFPREKTGIEKGIDALGNFINKMTGTQGAEGAENPLSRTVPSGSFGISQEGKDQAAINKGIKAAEATGIPSGSALAPGSFGISPEGKRQAAINKAQSAKNFGKTNLGITSESIKSSTPEGKASQFVKSGGGGGGNTGGTKTTQKSGFTKQGKPQTKAQKMATANIKKHGGTASAAKANKASMKAKAKKRHAAFKKRRAAKKKSKKK